MDIFDKPGVLQSGQHVVVAGDEPCLLTSRQSHAAHWLLGAQVRVEREGISLELAADNIHG